MEFNHDLTWENFEHVFNSRPTFKEGWNKILDFHQNRKEKPYWKELREIDFENEIIETKEWIEGLIKNNPLPEDIVALWVGLTKFLDESENESYAMYLTGSNTYNKNDIEWATEPIYLPEDRYVLFEALNRIDQLIKNNNDKDYDFLDWILPLSFTSLLVDHVIRTELDKTLFLEHRNNLCVSVGHDSGDYMNLTAIILKN